MHQRPVFANVIDQSVKNKYDSDMARPRDFDEDAVLAQVAGLFTEHGFNGTSIASLTERTGLAKQSLYNSFGDKEALYLQAVDYVGGRFAGVVEQMALAASGRAAIDQFFSNLLGVCLNPDPALNNCIVSAGLLEGIEVEAVAQKLQEKWQATRRILSQAIERGQQDGSVRRDIPAADLADILMNLTSGLRVSARAVTQKSQLKKIVKLSLGILDPA
jgi:TetR/AcrR family transcriptional regulator, transcriptional repressor for nem operon